MPKKALPANDRSSLSATGRLFSTALFLALALPGPWLFSGPAGQVSTALAAERQGAARQERATQQPNGAGAAIGPRSQTLAQNETQPEGEAESAEQPAPLREADTEQAAEQGTDQPAAEAEEGTQEEPVEGTTAEAPGAAPPAQPVRPAEPEAPAAPPPEQQAAAERIPYEKAFPDEFRKRLPVRIGLLASPVRPGMGEKVAAILRNYQRGRLERELGQRVQISFVSRSTRKHGSRTIIHYRPNFLKAAIKVASVVPREGVVEPMSARELERSGVDVIVYLGDRLR